MVYCSQCGKKNEEDAQFCSKCGAPLMETTRRRQEEWDRRCEEDCAGGTQGNRGWSIFWGLVIIIVGIWLIFEVVLKSLADSVEGLGWVKDITFEFWWVIIGIFALLIIITGLRMIIRNR
jgi:uncharacterized membrane protein YvbJ